MFTINFDVIHHLNRTEIILKNFPSNPSQHLVYVLKIHQKLIKRTIKPKSTYPDKPSISSITSYTCTDIDINLMS